MSPTDIEQIIDKYGRPVYEAALRQVYIEIVTNVIWVIALAALIALCLTRFMPWLRKRYREESEKSYGDTMECIMGMAGVGLVVSIATIICLAAITEIIGDVFNPTWAALQIILRAVGK